MTPAAPGSKQQHVIQPRRKIILAELQHLVPTPPRPLSYQPFNSVVTLSDLLQEHRLFPAPTKLEEGPCP